MRYEMTDEQIINLFKYCNESDCNACYGCFAYQDGKCTVQDLGVQVSQVIDRQKAEIERLKIKLNKAEQCIWDIEYASEKSAVSDRITEAIEEYNRGDTE